MNQHQHQQPDQETLWTRFINWLLGLFGGSSGAGTGGRDQENVAAGSSAGAAMDQESGLGSRLSDAATGVRETADDAIDRGEQTWDQLIGKDERTNLGDVEARARAATTHATDHARDLAEHASTADAIQDASAEAGATTGSAADSRNVSGGVNQGVDDAAAAGVCDPPPPGTSPPVSGTTGGAGTDSLLDEQPGMDITSSSTSSANVEHAGHPASSISAPASGQEMTGIEREAAERSRHPDMSDGSAGSADSDSADASQPTAASDGTSSADVDATANALGTGEEGREEDRLTLLAEPPVPPEDVVISSTTAAAVDPAQESGTGESSGAPATADERADSGNDSGSGDGADGFGSETGSADADVDADTGQSSYAEQEVGLSGSESGAGTETPADASSRTPTGADAEFVAGTDIDWSSKEEWEELEEEAAISEPAQPAQPATGLGTQDTVGTEPSAGTAAANASSATAPASEQADAPHGAVPGDGSRECPSDHPIKGNANSMIYHMPGQSSYDGTEPEFCFAQEEDAVAAGYRASKARGRATAGDEHEHQPDHDHAGTAGIAASGAIAAAAPSDTVPETSSSGATDRTQSTAETERSLESDADVSATPPADGKAANGGRQDAATGQQDATSSIASQPAGATATQRGSVPGDGSRSCPDGYPIKGNQNSMIYHMPNQSSYQGTKAEVCFATEDDAIAAGFRRRREAGDSGSATHGPHDSSSTSSSGDRAAMGLRGEHAVASASPTQQHQDRPSGSVVGDGTRECPEGYPIKGNASSQIYHMPGQAAYEVTEPEFCFATEEAATAAGYRAAKR